MDLKPSDTFCEYFVYNNIGFSLIQLQRYIEAENCLRKAIELDSSRANGFKNLGLSLEGQGRFSEAAWNYVAAVKANASDPRALAHLEELIACHKEIFGEMANLSYHFNLCRQAVAFAAEKNKRN